MAYLIGLYVMAAVYFVAGVWHLVQPDFYKRVVPRWLPARTTLVYLSGLVEIALAVGLLFPVTRAESAWGIIAMLLVYLLVHFNMVLTPGANLGLPGWALWARIAAQGALVWWAWLYTA